MNKSRPCVEALKQGISDSFTMYFRAHAYHWNVQGSDFSQYHEFFSDIYEDVYESIDQWAENIRKLNALAPQSVAEIGMPSRIEDVFIESDPMEMSIALYEANEVVISSIDVAFKIANEINEQGIADFLASRDDMHKKWRWQLNAITGIGNKSEEGEEEEMEDEMLPSSDGAYDVNRDDDYVYFGDRTEKEIASRLARHNKRAPASLQASAEVVRAVFRRGALTASASTDRNKSGLTRVDAFLRLLSSGRPANSLYKVDNDLLPSSHARSTYSEDALVASAAAASLTFSDLETIDRPEEYVLALAELSGMGYEIEPAIRASWLRAVNSGESPRERSLSLVTDKYDSKDSDLLPTL
jgi:starvation-inducible DNA-binding protein